jgi:hypothetical protein
VGEELVPRFVAETDLERELMADPQVREGLAWGAERWGHPEGHVGMHVADILEDIGRKDPKRADLRFIAIVHDSQKFRVDPDGPRTKENDHAWLAREVAARYVHDPRLLEAIELHDEPYRRWRDGDRDREDLLDDILARIPDVPLYVDFIELDATTEGKDLSFLFWLRFRLAARGLLPPSPPLDPERMLEGGAPTAYVQSLVTPPEHQDAIAAAIVAEAGRRRLPGDLEILRSADGLRVAVIVRWEGEAAPHVLAARGLIRAVLARHPVLLEAKPLEAHAYAIVPLDRP